MRRCPSFPVVLALLVAACTSHEGADGRPPHGAPAVQFRGSIASVSLVQDCPDAAADAEAPPAAAAKMDPTVAAERSAVEPGAAAYPGDGGGWSPPCTQSVMQLNVAHDGADAQPMTIVAARLTAAGTGAHVAMVPVRNPMRWDDGGRYAAWDERIPAASVLEVSYALGEPQRSALGRLLGNDDDGRTRYILEVDIAFASRTITIRSGEFQRDYPHVVVT